MWTIETQRINVLNTAYRSFAGDQGAGFVDVTVEVTTEAPADKLELWLVEEGAARAPAASRREKNPFVAKATSGASLLVSARFPVTHGTYQVVVGDGTDGSNSSVPINV